MISIMFLIYLVSVVVTGLYIHFNHKVIISYVNEDNIKNNRRKLTTKEEYLVVYMFVFLPIYNTYIAAIIIKDIIIKLIKVKH